MGFRIHDQKQKDKITELITTLTSPRCNEKYITPISKAQAKVIARLLHVPTGLAPFNLSTSLITR